MRGWGGTPAATIATTTTEDLVCVRTFLLALTLGDARAAARCRHPDCAAALPGEPPLGDALAIARYAAARTVRLLQAHSTLVLPPVVAIWGVCHRIDPTGALRRERVTLLFLVARGRIVHWQLRRIGEDRVARQPAACRR